MPAAVGLILTGINCGRGGIKSLFYRLGIWRVGWKWWAAAALTQPALLILAALIYALFYGSLPVDPIPLESAAFLMVNVIMLLIATLGEEIGWHGVALPGLQSRYSALVSGFILALLWGIWHIPFWLLLDTFDEFGFAYLALNFMLVFPLTFNINWIFNHTRASLLMPVVFHLTFNITNNVFLPVTLILQRLHCSSSWPGSWFCRSSGISNLRVCPMGRALSRIPRQFRGKN